MPSCQTIVYTGNFSIEKMNAAGKRVFGNALVMKKLGYHMVMVGVDSEDRTSLTCDETKTVLEGMEVYHYPGTVYQNKRTNYHAFFKQFKNLLEKEHWDVRAVIGYNSPSLAPFIGKVIKYSHKHGIKYITDVADWLIVDSPKFLFRMGRQLDIALKNRYYSNMSDGVIAVSSWLADYYKKRIENVIVIPPLSREKSGVSCCRTMVPQIVYAGIPFSKGVIMQNPSAMKDRFDFACYVLDKVKQAGGTFKFHVYGFSKEEFLYSISGLKEVVKSLGDSIEFHGMTSMSEVQEAVKAADYTVLIREVNRMTMAGFPTKVSESIICGTPVITTRTSDIDKYLQEGDGAYYIDIRDELGAVEIIGQLLNRTVEEREKEKQKCAQIESFRVDTYINVMQSFLDSVINGK